MKSGQIVAVNSKLSLRRRLKKYYGLLLLMIPGLGFILLFNYGPLYGLQIAFKNYDVGTGILESPWVGIKHFKVFFANPEVWNIVTNTLEISLLKLAFTFPTTLIFALLLNELRHMRFKKTVQTISYLPHFLSWVVVAGLINDLLNPTKGIPGLITSALGMAPAVILTSPIAFRVVLVISDIWKGVGWGSIIYLAGISGIDTQLYEAASIDGASRFRRAISITIPQLFPVIAFLLVMSVSGLLSAGFDQIFNLYSPLVYQSADVIDTYVYRMGLGHAQYSLSTAIGLMQNVVAFILLISANFITNKFMDAGVW